MPDLFEVIVGTYEQYLLGYKVNNVVNVSEYVSLYYLIVGYVRCLNMILK